MCERGRAHRREKEEARGAQVEEKGSAGAIAHSLSARALSIAPHLLQLDDRLEVGRALLLRVGLAARVVAAGVRGGGRGRGRLTAGCGRDAGEAGKAGPSAKGGGRAEDGGGGGRVGVSAGGRGGGGGGLLWGVGRGRR